MSVLGVLRFARRRVVELPSRPTRLAALATALVMVAAIPAAAVVAAGPTSTTHPATVRSSATRSAPTRANLALPDPGPTADIRINTRDGGRLIGPYSCENGLRCSQTMRVHARYMCSGTYLPLNTSLIPQSARQEFSATESGAYRNNTVRGYVEGPSPTCDGSWHSETIFIPVTNGGQTAWETDRYASFNTYVEASLNTCDAMGCTRSDREYSTYISSPRP
jgi:hypothetical protein